MTTKPDFMLTFPPVDEATSWRIRDALVEATKLALRAGYDPEQLGRALIGAGVSLHLDMHGSAGAIDRLNLTITAVKRLDAAQPAGGRLN